MMQRQAIFLVLNYKLLICTVYLTGFWALLCVRNALAHICQLLLLCQLSRRVDRTRRHFNHYLEVFEVVRIIGVKICCIV